MSDGLRFLWLVVRRTLWLLVIWVLLLLGLFGLASLCCGICLAAPQDACARISSHGASCTCIATGPGRSYFLSCGHAFEGRDRTKPITLDVPSPTPGQTAQRPGIRLVAVDYQADLSLIEMLAGPLPYVCHVAATCLRGHRLLSAGYDDMKWPATQRPATLLGSQGLVTFTRERPWHGRSGGGLIDLDSGQLVGVVQGYSGPPDRREVVQGAQGMYASLGAIQTFLVRWQPALVQTPAPTGLPLDADGWDGSIRPVPLLSAPTPGAPTGSEGRQWCPPGWVCPPGGPCLPAPQYPQPSQRCPT